MDNREMQEADPGCVNGCAGHLFGTRVPSRPGLDETPAVRE